MPVTRPPRLPRPSWDDLSFRAELSTARQRVLDEVESAHRPLRTAEVADRLGLHHNTVREHLDALVEAGFVRATPAATGRRGRPALLYSSTAPDPGEVLDSYLALLDAVAEFLGQGEQAESSAREIGRRWAQATIPTTATPSPAAEEGSGPGTGSATTPVPDDHVLAGLVAHLAVMGFAPEAAGDGLVLKACPLVTGRRVPHDLVCLMHEACLTAICEASGIAAGTQEPPASTTAEVDPGTDQASGTSPRLTVTPLLPDGCHLTLATNRSSAAAR